MGLIVNADDFGKNENVNKAITECFNRGIIGRTTIMTNMPFATEALSLSLKNGFSENVGLHINITEGKPLSDDIKSNPNFCDENGIFNAAFYHNTKQRLKMDNKSIADVEKEIRAQIEAYRELGFTLNHIDSHHHAHTNYPIYLALKNLSKECDFSSIRLSRNLYKNGNFLKNTYKKCYNGMIKKICRSTSDYFGSFLDAAVYFDYPEGSSSLKDFSDFCNRYNLEIMVHPMYNDENILVDTEMPFEKETGLYEAFEKK